MRRQPTRRKITKTKGSEIPTKQTGRKKITKETGRTRVIKETGRETFLSMDLMIQATPGPYFYTSTTQIMYGQSQKKKSMTTTVVLSTWEGVYTWEGMIRLHHETQFLRTEP